MAFDAKDLMVSILPSDFGDVTCPEHTITPTICADMISTAVPAAVEDGLAALRQQLRVAVAQPAD